MRGTKQRKQTNKQQNTPEPKLVVFLKGNLSKDRETQSAGDVADDSREEDEHVREGPGGNGPGGEDAVCARDEERGDDGGHDNRERGGGRDGLRGEADERDARGVDDG